MKMMNDYDIMQVDYDYSYDDSDCRVSERTTTMSINFYDDCCKLQVRLAKAARPSCTVVDGVVDGDVDVDTTAS